MMLFVLFVNIFIINNLFSFNDNVAVVWWVGFDNRSDFKEDKKLIPKLCKTNGVFCVNENNMYGIRYNINFISDFTDKLRNAVEKIKDQENPILIVILGSHGGGGYICQEGKDDIEYSRIINTVAQETYNSSDKKRNKISIKYLISACYSGTFIDKLKISKHLLKSRLTQKNINDRLLYCTNSNDNCSIDLYGIYRAKIEVFTASHSDELSYGTLFFDRFLNFAERESYMDTSGTFLFKRTVIPELFDDREAIGEDNFAYWRTFAPDLELYNFIHNDIITVDFVYKYPLFVLKRLNKQETWSDEIWKIVPDLLTSENENIRTAMKNVLYNRKVFTDVFWGEIFDLLMNDDSKYSKGLQSYIATLLRNYEGMWPEWFWRELTYCVFYCSDNMASYTKQSIIFAIGGLRAMLTDYAWWIMEGYIHDDNRRG